MVGSKVRVSAIIPAYNEVTRISNVIESLKDWVVEIIVFDKSSTDGMSAYLEQNYPEVVVVHLPYSNKGEEDFNIYFQYVKYDWVFICTCAEVVTNKLAANITQRFLDLTSSYDLIYVPRKFYSLGFHNESSPWSYADYPFFFNWKKIKVTNVLHEHVKVDDKSLEYFLTPSNDGCVIHITHNGVDDYMSSMCRYVKAEVEELQSSDINSSLLNKYYTQYSIYSFDLKHGGKDTFGQYCAWNIYWHGVMLHAWEKGMDESIYDYNKYILEAMLDQEWHGGSANIRNIKTSMDEIKIRKGFIQFFVNSLTKFYRKNKKIVLFRQIRNKYFS
jgi:glycosyltransferase involved in cell wall biosynthesis